MPDRRAREAREAVLDGLELLPIPEPQGTPPLQVPSDMVAGVVNAMRGAHRQYSVGTDIREGNFRSVFDPLV